MTSSDRRFIHASTLREKGEYQEAIREFLDIAEHSQDDTDKAGALLNVAATLRAAGDLSAARARLDEIRALPVFRDLDKHWRTDNPNILWVVIAVETEYAENDAAEGRNTEALTRLDSLLSTYREKLESDSYRDSYEIIQSRRAYLLADLGRWQDALSILESNTTFQERNSVVSFYLGHCYLCGRAYDLAKLHLVEALRGSLSKNLQFRANCELGMVHFRLQEYREAKREFEKCLENADSDYIRQAKLFDRLEATCRQLNEGKEAEQYALLANQTALKN